MKCWVTGATGQVGFILCQQLADLGHDVFGLSRHSLGLPSRCRWLPWDADLTPTFPDSASPPDVIVHLAGQTSAYVARQNPSSDAVTNVVGMLNLLDAVKRIGGKPFVVLSGAATEVGLVSAGSVTDDLPDRPPTFYDVGKIAQRLYLQQYRAEGWIDGASLRLGNVYGGATARPNSDRGFLNSSMHAALKGEDLYYFGDGEYVRDFIHVDDVARAFVAAIEHRDQTSGETFMIGTNVGTRMRDVLSVIAHEAASMTGETSRLIEVQPPQDMNSIDKRDSRIDSSRFIARTDWVPSISLRAGVRMTLEAMAASQSAARTDQSRFFQKSS